MLKLTGRLKQLFSGEHGIRRSVLLGLAGMVLILLSGLLPERTARGHPPETAAADPADPDAYRAALESRLQTLLCRMEGVGDAAVMVTVSGSAEQIFAQEVKASQSEHSTQTESAYVLARSGGNESPLIAETRYPAVEGVAVLCADGDHAAVQERISRAVATVLGIPQSRVYVGKSAN